MSSNIPQPKILSLTFGGHDTSAALMVGGKLVAACAQERYSLDKHSRRFPIDAIKNCLEIGGIRISDLSQIAFCDDTRYLIRERYLRPDVGCDLTKLLFEPSNRITEIRIKELITETIKIHEKRAIVKNVDVKSVRDGLGYDVTIVFAIKGIISSKGSNLKKKVINVFTCGITLFRCKKQFYNYGFGCK